MPPKRQDLLHSGRVIFRDLQLFPLGSEIRFQFETRLEMFFEIAMHFKSFGADAARRISRRLGRFRFTAFLPVAFLGKEFDHVIDDLHAVVSCIHRLLPPSIIGFVAVCESKIVNLSKISDPS